jgi:hypothetical protein
VETALNAKRKAVLNSGIGVVSGNPGEVSEAK